MSDPIEKLCGRYRFNEMMKNKKESIVSMVRLIYRAYEVFYGAPSSPPIDIIKKIIMIFIEISPEYVWLRLNVPADVAEQVLNRVIEKVYKIAEAELIKRKELDYISS